MTAFVLAAALAATNPGERVILVTDNGFPFVHLTLYFRVGPALDPPEKQGLTALTNRMLMRGTARRGRAELEEAIEALGTELYTSTQAHAVSLGASVLSRHLDELVGILGEMLREPAFAPEELDKVRREMLAELEAARDEDAHLARSWFRRLVFPEHPFGHRASGQKATLERITVDDVRAHFARYWTRSNLVVAASGDVEEATLKGLLDRALAGLGEGEAVDWEAFPAVAPAAGRRVALVDKADRTQAQIVVGHPTVPAAHPDFLALSLATTAFGGTFTARLMQEVRVKRGLSYGAYARLASERAAGFYALTAAPSAGDAVDTVALLLSEYDRFVREGLTDEEIDFARGYLVNAFPFSVETPALRAAQQVRAVLLGRPADFLETYLAKVKALSADEVRAAVRRHLTPDDLVVVMVCSAPELREAVGALTGVTAVEVHPYNEE